MEHMHDPGANEWCMVSISTCCVLVKERIFKLATQCYKQA